MPKSNPLELAARFIAALYQATDGKPGRFRRATDVAQRAGIKRAADVDTAWKTAEAAGFLVTRVDEPGWIMLTQKGIQSAAGRQSTR